MLRIGQIVAYTNQPGTTFKIFGKDAQVSGWCCATYNIRSIDGTMTITRCRDKDIIPKNDKWFNDFAEGKLK